MERDQIKASRLSDSVKRRMCMRIVRRHVALSATAPPGPGAQPWGYSAALRAHRDFAVNLYKPGTIDLTSEPFIDGFEIYSEPIGRGLHTRCDRVA